MSELEIRIISAGAITEIMQINWMNTYFSPYLLNSQKSVNLRKEYRRKEETNTTVKKLQWICSEYTGVSTH